jgi:hypothetical protein
MIHNFEEFIEIFEKCHYDDEVIRSEYVRSLSSPLKKGEEPKKKDINKFFQLHKEKMQKALDEDEKNVNSLCESELKRLGEKLESSEDSKKKKIEEKIKKIEAYRESQLNDIKESRNKYKQWFNSNPKIIIA